MSVARIAFTGPSLELFAAARDAMDRIPPAFPLAATVAVNPWLGQIGEDRAIAAARMARTGAGRVFLPRAEIARRIEAGEIGPDDLAAAAGATCLGASDLRDAASSEPAAIVPDPTVVDLAAAATGVDWPDLVDERIGAWAASHFDRGQAFWPAPATRAFASWRSFAGRDLSPDIAGLPGFSKAVAELPSDPRMAFAESCATLGLTPAAAALYFHRLLVTLSGWGQHARHIDWLAKRDGTPDETLFDLLTIRLVWDAAVLQRFEGAIGPDWAAARARFGQPVAPNDDHLIDAALQEAADRAAERRLAEKLDRPAQTGDRTAPEIQAAFCIDVRSERMRRALESVAPSVQTIGFAGFFGLAVAHRDHASDIVEARAPILLRPAVETCAAGPEAADTARRIDKRAIRAWGRFKRAAVSAFAFVEAAGPLYVGKILRDGLGLLGTPKAAPAPRLDLPLADRVDAAAGILTAMSLTEGFARLILIAGHGARVTNAPHASALQCGACGGHAGDVNARLLAGLLNDPEIRAGLAGRGIRIPDGTHVIAGLHDTVSDRVALFDEDAPASHRAEIARLRAALDRAGHAVRVERAIALPRATDDTMAARGLNWSELRAEWGLAGCSAFVAAPRGRTRGVDLGGGVFLHDYDRQQDPRGETLETILTAPVIVASWIALQYHGSTVAPETFGSGNKLLHNVVGGIGVLEGNGGALRVGLPMQSVHDGERAIHGAQRLTVVIDAAPEAIGAILDRHETLRDLFGNGWLALYAMDAAGGLGWRYEGGHWIETGGPGLSAAA
ncbi:DUF2309 domain-containing protein [Palleronia sediminis]|uniref:Probable inorganic carbon transporter subunit DabA n=1 Tax=Palleronia sediminis TaxID=2547833 RepID=A0A4V3BA28_9RHOB|nr:DUF2309 domain-containing protein [Palleronia sediminis]TDL81489.1 DUF2309 domain-containing protein [Palleronia sediminis]